MSFFKPTQYIDYVPPRLVEGKVWYISYYVKDPATGKLKRFRIKVNRARTLKEKRAAAKAIIAQLQEQLALGWNPILEKTAPKSYCTLAEALDAFLKIKGKETEENSMRSYRSYIRILKDWIKEKGYSETMYACSFDRGVALEFMRWTDDNDRLSARTYNNYLAFYRSLFNWMEDRGYLSVNPFKDMKKKPKKLTKKIRTTLDDSELSRLFRHLHSENREYLVMCLLCYCCLMRPKEIALLRCGDVDPERQVIHVRPEIAKNDNDSYRTIPDTMMPYIREIDLTHPDWYLFADHPGYDFTPGREQVCSRKIAKYWSEHIRPRCGLGKEIQFYSLKDTGVTNMIGSGVPISFVQQQADHSSVAMTAIYLGRQQAKATEELKNVDIIK